MAQRDDDQLDEALRARIRDAGLRATQGRVVVYRHLLEAGRPVSHNDVVDALAGLQLDRASVYRNLMDLTRAGLLRRFDVGDHVWRFESSEGEDVPDEHVHFVCVDCGNVQCLPTVEVKVEAGRGAPAAVSQQRVEVQLRGVCDTCH